MPKLPRTSKARKPKKVVERDPELDRLVEIATSLGLDVREERLLREVGYSVKSGLCRVEGEEVLLLDKNAASSDRIEALCEVLAGRDLDSVWIEPELRSRITASAEVVEGDPAAASPGTSDESAVPLPATP